MEDMKITEMPDGMRNNIDNMRQWVKGHYSENADERYSTVEGKLELLDVILKAGWIKPGETGSLQCLGITLGDALAQKLGLHWVQVEDSYGIDPALRYKETSVLLFPLTMISKRVEQGEEFNVHHLFELLVDGVNDMLAKGDYD